MGSIYIGANKLKKCYLGTAKVKAIYLGVNKVFSGTPEFVYNGVTYSPTEEQINSGYRLPLESSGSINFISFDNSMYKLTACVIGGGGAGGYSYYDGEAGRWSNCKGGGGAEGGEVHYSEVSPTENYAYTIAVGGGATSTSTNGGDSSAFGISSLGGIGGVTPPNQDYEYGAGGSGRGGADGGRGHFHSGDAWGHEANAPYGTYDAGVGADGTYFYDRYYGGGGGGYTDIGNTGNGAGQENYGGGGMGAYRNAGDTRHHGKNGAVILLIQNR